MHYILAVRLARFYISELLSQRPELDSSPLVIVREGLVWDVDGWGRERGVIVGMPHRQARAILATANWVEYERDPYVVAQRRWLDRLVAYTDCLEPVHPHLAFLDLSTHPSPERLLPGLMTDVRQDLAAEAILGIGRTKWLAELGTYHGLRPSAVHAPAEYLSALPVQDLTPVSEPTRERLRFLGYATIGDVQGLSFEVLHRQFPHEARTIFESVRGIGGEPVQSIYPENSVTAHFAFPTAVDSTEGLDAGLSVLARRLAERLSNADAQGFEVIISVETEEGAVMRFERTFTKPLYGGRSLLFTLHLMLDDHLKEPISLVRVTLPRIRRQRGYQANLMRPDARSQTQAIEQTRNVFGEGSIVRASDIRTPWDQRFLRAWEKGLGHG